MESKSKPSGVSPATPVAIDSITTGQETRKRIAALFRMDSPKQTALVIANASLADTVIHVIRPINQQRRSQASEQQ